MTQGQFNSWVSPVIEIAEWLGSIIGKKAVKIQIRAGGGESDYIALSEPVFPVNFATTVCFYPLSMINNRAAFFLF